MIGSPGARRRLIVIGLFAAVTVTAIAVGGRANARGDRSAAVPPARSLWLPVPDVRGLSVEEAVRRTEAAGWRRNGGGAPSHRTYLLRAWREQSEAGVVRPQWGTVACGSRLKDAYLLEVGVAKSRSDCHGLLASLPGFIAFRQRGGWVAVWGMHANIELWSPRVGFRSVWGDLGGGSCDRRAKSRVFHVGRVGPRMELLGRSTWHLLVTASLGPSERDRDRDQGVCVTHRGTRDFVPDHSSVSDETVSRRVSTTGVEVEFGPKHSRFRVRVVRARHGRAAAVTVSGPDWRGSSPGIAHVRPGTCRRVSGPEHPFVIEPVVNADGEYVGSMGRVVVPIAFAVFVSRPHVLELHEPGDGAGVEACARVGA